MLVFSSGGVPPARLAGCDTGHLEEEPPGWPTPVPRFATLFGSRLPTWSLKVCWVSLTGLAETLGPGEVNEGEGADPHGAAVVAFRISRAALHHLLGSSLESDPLLEPRHQSTMRKCRAYTKLLPQTL